MKIAIVSDIHDNWLNLEKALKIANDLPCEYLLFAGDLIAPPGIALLDDFKGEVVMVWGNNELAQVSIQQQVDKRDNIFNAGDHYEGEIAGLKFFMHHIPRYAELAADTEEFDVAICGHTHEYFTDVIGDTILINPGEIHGYKTGEPSLVILDSETKQLEKISLNDY
jgi:uncharacterized protein